MASHPIECRTCGRRLPKRAFRQECAGCIKRGQGFENVRIAARLEPGLVTVYRFEWRRKAA